MTLPLLSFLLTAAFVQDGAAPAPAAPAAPAQAAKPADAEARAALVAACSKLQTAKSYAFELKSESTGGGGRPPGGGGDGGGGGNSGPRVATPIEAQFQNGVP